MPRIGLGIGLGSLMGKSSVGGTPPEPTTFNAVIVSGAGVLALNGTYTERGIFQGKPYYNLVDWPDNEMSNAISFLEGDMTWYIWSLDDGGYYASYDNNSQFPWEGTPWVTANGFDPAPTLTPTNV
jgi:hypothetical protein